MESQRPEDTKALAQPQQGVKRKQEPTMIERRVSLDGLTYTYPESVSSWDPRQANEMWHSAGLAASESASSNKKSCLLQINAKSQEALAKSQSGAASSSQLNVQLGNVCQTENRGGKQATPEYVHLQCALSGNSFSYSGIGGAHQIS